MSNKKTASDAEALAEPVDVAMVKVELINPATAVLEANVRSKPEISVEFLDAIRAEGVREPVKARRSEDGTVHVYDGQRRLLAAREAGLAAIPAVFGLAEQTGTAAGRITDQLRTFAREGLSTADRVAAVQHLTLEGVSVTRIARSTGTSRQAVKDILTVAASPTATAAAAEYEQLTLDRLVAIAEFDGDEEAAEAIAECDVDDLDYVVQRIRDDRTIAGAEQALVARLEAEGHTVYTDYPAGAEGLYSLTDADADAEERPTLTVEGHAACPGRCVYLRVYGADEDDYRLTDLCTRPELHHARYGRRDSKTPKGVARPGESEEDRIQREADETEAARAERARVIANNRSWRTAITVRKTWVAGLIARKKLPADVDVFIGISLTHHVQTLTDYRADEAIDTFLGLKETTYRRREAGNLLTDTPTKAHQVALAVVLSAREAQAADEHCWRSVREAVASYLLALEAWGYHLSDVERLAAGYPSED